MVFRPSSDKFSIKFVNVRDRLTLMSERSHSRMVELYSLDEEGCGVWSKMYGVLLYGADLSQGSKNSDEIVFEKIGMMYCYDQKSNTSKRILSAGCGDISNCFTYTPSLAFHQGMQSVHLQTETQTRTLGYNSTTPWRLISSLIKEPFTEDHNALVVVSWNFVRFSSISTQVLLSSSHNSNLRSPYSLSISPKLKFCFDLPQLLHDFYYMSYRMSYT